MRRRGLLPVALAVLGVAALAAAVAALAAQHGGRAAAQRAASPPCEPPLPGNHPVTFGTARPALLLHVPTAAPQGRRPLVLVLPGAGMTGTDMAHATGYARLADRDNFLVAYPTASGTWPAWNVSTRGPDDVGYLRRVIRALTGNAACADPGRVGVTGLADGARMSVLLACRAPGLVAAVAPVTSSTLPGCRPARPLPLLEIHPPGGAAGSSLAAWRATDACSAAARRRSPARNVRERRWRCGDGALVVDDRVVDPAHAWPGGPSLKPFSATAATWAFLSAFRAAQRS